MSINLIIIIAILLISNKGFKDKKWMYQLALYPKLMRENNNQWYRIITSGFVHGSWNHLIFNLITLYFFGSFIEDYLGVIHYLTLFTGGVIFGNLPSIIKESNRINYYSLGASGGISSLLFAFIYLFPTQKIYIFFILPIPAYLFGLIFLIYSIYAHFKLKDGVNHLAHLSGAIFGLLWILLLF